MREHKYRAWDKTRKTMIGASDISHFDLTGTERQLYYYYPEQISEDEWEQAQGTQSLKNIELMQYTGLKDKNGKEIYEGDIVVGYNAGGETCDPRLVKWTNNGYVANGLSLWAVYKCKVIGNIYENKELL